MKNQLTIIGGGLAGSEAAWQAAERGISVVLYEMRPHVPTVVHKTDLCAELVCSNSLGSNQETNAPFILKEELRNLNSLIMRAADRHAVPAGGALAVDRDLFSREITQAILEHPNIDFKREEVGEISFDGPVIVATGPLTTPSLSNYISDLVGQNYLYFYDALSPIVDSASIDYEKAFFASRYDKGGDDYLNCGMSEAQYHDFVHELKGADKVALKPFEKPVYFEGCMPIEELALRGDMTLAFGPFKPVGLCHPKTGERYFAVVQLRRENKQGTAYNLVGFQTKLTYPEQKRLVRMIPGLENSEFFRFGAIHRNTFINAPVLLSQDLSLKIRPNIYFAGQIIGVEGYMESCAMGMLAGLSVAERLRHREFDPPPMDTALGALLGYVTQKRKTEFQPMNVNFGLFPGIDSGRMDKRARNAMIVKRAKESFEFWRKRMQ
jgi:methylenetetrahydrofolate--tRNA-(uracil-5-)-methyltransferase